MTMKTYDELVSAKLFSYTQLDPNYGVDLEGLTELVAYAAKVSNPSAAKQAEMRNASRLIDYLISHKHWSPLEMVDCTLDLMTTRDISHQVIRHRSFSFQEFSQRYAEVLTEDDQGIQMVLSEARLQDHDNRQNSIRVDLSDPEQEDLYYWWEQQQKEQIERVANVYQEAISRGLAKEVARKILPEGLTATRVFMKGSLRSWVHYIELRSGHGTQLEHMMLANAIAEAIQKCFPMVNEFIEGGPPQEGAYLLNGRWAIDEFEHGDRNPVYLT